MLLSHFFFYFFYFFFSSFCIFIFFFFNDTATTEIYTLSYTTLFRSKRIEATIQVDKTGAVSDAIKGIVGGFTISEGKGRGSGKRQEIRSGRGTGSFTAEYNKVATVITIVDDSDVEKVSSAIADASFTGNGGDRKAHV